MKRYLRSFSWKNLEKIQTDFLVLGSGVAGLRAAIGVSQAGEVVIISKESPEQGSTWYAQGGIAVAMG